MKKPTYLSPGDVAGEMAWKHATDTFCSDCEALDDRLCRWHDGYREGVMILLLKASVQ